MGKGEGKREAGRGKREGGRGKGEGGRGKEVYFHVGSHGAYDLGKMRPDSTVKDTWDKDSK